MALTDKNLLITPNIGSSTADPKIDFVGADVSSSVTITATMYADGTLSFDSALGQLFSIRNVATGTIFSVADISGTPIIEVDDDGEIRLNPTFGSVGIGIIPTEKLHVSGNILGTGTVQGTRFISTQATGTAPFTVSSTTVVTNLNADLLDGQSGAYYLDWTNITNKPDPQITVTLTGDVTGTQTSTFTDLANGTISVTATVVDASHNHVISNVDNLQTTLDAKWPINGAAPVDLDTAGQGLWRINTGHTNQPANTNYGTLLSFDNSSDTGFQIATDYIGNQLYYRSGNASVYGGAGSFSAWRKVWHDANDGPGSGLDADLLDGRNANLFMTQDTGGTINVNADNNTVSAAAIFTGSTGSWTNRGPAADNSGALLTLRTHTGNYYSQIWFDTGGNNIYHRKSSNALPTGSWSKIWQESNDGTGSGLDADLLDGQEGSYYLDWANVTSKPDPIVAVTLTGDVTGTNSVTLTDLATNTYTITVATTIAANSVALGTDTTGNYIATIAGTTNQVNVSGSGSETAAVTLSLPQDIHTAATPTFSRLTLSQTTGTAPLTVSSTTVVTNLNADLLDGQQGTYYLDWTNVTNKPDPIVAVTLTGDVTGTNSVTLTDLATSTYTVTVATSLAAGIIATADIANDAVDNTKLANMAQDTIKGRASGAGTGDPTDLTAAQVITILTGADGTGTGLDADLLDGQHGSYYQSASNLNAGTVAFARLDAANDTGGEFPISDRRALGDVSPDSYRDKAATFSFSDDYPTLGSWGSALTMKGWADGYYAWQIISYASTGADAAKENLFFRTGVSSTWNTLRKVWDSGNDGSGSGLDADTLDTYDSTAFPRKSENATVTGAWVFNNGGFTNSQHQYSNLYNPGVDDTVYIHSYPSGWAGGTTKFEWRSWDGVSAPKHLRWDGTGALRVDGNLVWHAANDGAGSTLDADLLDGQQGSYYLDWTNVTNKPDPQITVTISGDVTATNSVTLTDLATGTYNITLTASLGTGVIVTGDITDDAVTNAKLANMAQATIKGRADAAGTGDPTDLTAAQVITIINTADGAGSLLDSDLLDGQEGAYYRDWTNITNKPDPVITVTLTGNVTGSGNQTFTDLGNGTISFATTIAADAVANTMIRNSVANSVIGRSTNSTGDPADIQATVDGTVLRLSGTTLGFGTVATAGITDDAVTDAKLRNSSGYSVIGNPDAAAGNPSDIIADSEGQVLVYFDGLLAFGQVVTDSIADNAVTGDKFADYSITSNKIADASINSDKIDTSDTYVWFGPHSFKGDLNVDGVAYFNNASAKLGTSVTVTTDNGSGIWFNLASGAKTAGILALPTTPTISITANDGSGNYSTLGMGSGGFNFQFGGTADIAINSTPGALNEIIVAQGDNAAPVWKHLCPPIRYAWTDFYSPNASQAQDPYFGTAIQSGTQSASPGATYLVAGVAGLCLIRSSTSANSGFRWITENIDRIVGQADLYFRAILAIADDMTNKTVRFGFGDMANQNDAVDGTYFELTAGSLVCTPKTSSNSTRTSGSTYTLTAGTFYVFEVYWDSTSSVNFKIKSLDEATTHLNTSITTNIPTGTSRVFGAGLVATSSGTAQDDLLVVDYMGHGFKNRR